MVGLAAGGWRPPVTVCVIWMGRQTVENELVRKFVGGGGGREGDGIGEVKLLMRRGWFLQYPLNMDSLFPVNSARSSASASASLRSGIISSSYMS